VPSHGWRWTEDDSVISCSMNTASSILSIGNRGV
jgi:hypothetical protein